MPLLSFSVPTAHVMGSASSVMHQEIFSLTQLANKLLFASAPSITMLRSLSRARPPLRAPTCTRAATYPAHYYNYKSPNDIPIRTNLRGSELLNTPAVSMPSLFGASLLLLCCRRRRIRRHL